MKDTPARTIYWTFRPARKAAFGTARTASFGSARARLPRRSRIWDRWQGGFVRVRIEVILVSPEAGIFPPVCAQRATLSPAWRLREIRGPPVCHHHRGGSPIGGVSGWRALHGMPRTSLHPRRSARSGRRRPPSASRARRSVVFASSCPCFAAPDSPVPRPATSWRSWTRRDMRRHT